MKKILIIIYIIIFQTFANADDVSDFQIEGISVGDSLLDYFSESEIKNRTYSGYKSETFVRYVAKENKQLFQTYDTVDFHYKTNDKNYTIYSIGGATWYVNKLEECNKKMYEIVDEMLETFKNALTYDAGTTPWLEVDESGKTITTNYYFTLQNGDYIEIACYDWSDKITEEKGYTDHLKVALVKKEFGDWLNDEAY